jgi:prepilin-type N-terminal cleavage/methylation domain-containing protein
MTPQARRGEAGLTLIELMIALVVFSAVLAGTLAFLRAQGRSFTLGSQRAAMLQNGRFAFQELERNLRTAGSGTPDIQPSLVYLDTSVVAFNADFVTKTPGDVFAVYFNPDAPDGSTGAMTQAMRTPIPLAAVAYPDTNYMTGLINSPAETIVFFFQPDSTTARPDDYVLYRRVNNLAPEVVSRNLLRAPGTPFFQYFRQVNAALTGTESLQPVPPASLPLRHTVPIHLTLADTVPAGVISIDSVRAVSVTFAVTNGLTGTAERRRTLSRYIRLPNVGLGVKKTCGDEPILGTTLTATWNASVVGVDLTWNAAVDELAGERDVQRYVIWRRLTADTGWGDPYSSLPPGGTPTYIYTDQAVTAGAHYLYALAAQDCTPSNSGLVQSGEVDVP